MDADYLVQTLDFIQRNRKLAKKRGMAALETGRNFDRFRDIVKEVGRPLSEHFDDRYMDRLYQYGTWIVGRDKRDRAIAIAALRLDDLGQTTLADNLRTQLRRVNGGLVLKEAPGLDRISGKTVYAGQVWVHEKYRERQIAPLFTELLQAIALLQYSPNVVYGTIDKELVEDGFAARSTFVHQKQRAYLWLENPRYLPDYHIVWNELSDIHWLIEKGCEKCVHDERTQKTMALQSRTS